MPDNETSAIDGPDNKPNFEMPRHGAIREDNWAEYQAQGFLPVIEDLNFTQTVCGVENVYTGDEYDYDAMRPLRHKSGTGIYVNPNGLKRRKVWFAEHTELLQRLDLAHDDLTEDPDAS